jgi:hypothetical protein
MSISKYTFLVGAMTSILAASTAAADDVAASVAARLRESGQLEDYRVNVKESEGTVFLEGEVTDARQIAAALAVAEDTEGVERVVNRLTLRTVKKRAGIKFGLPASMRGLLGVEPETPFLATATGDSATPQSVAQPTASSDADAGVFALPSSVSSQAGEIELVKVEETEPQPSVPEAETRPVIEPAAELVVTAAQEEPLPQPEPKPAVDAVVQQAAVDVPQADVSPVSVAESLPQSAEFQPQVAGVVAAEASLPAAPPQQPQRRNTPRPMAVARASAIPTQPDTSRTEQAAPKPSSGLSSWVKQVAGVMGGGERVVPGSERVVADYGPGEYQQSAPPQAEYYMQEGYAGAGQQPVPGYVPQGGGLGRPMPMGAAGVGMPPVPMRGDGPNMPNYAWPSYASYPNYAALQYPTQYSPTAWPYIGPFYPYPQVPLGWRRVSLEWDDGWWFLDFDDRPQHH